MRGLDGFGGRWEVDLMVDGVEMVAAIVRGVVGRREMEFILSLSLPFFSPFFP